MHAEIIKRLEKEFGLRFQATPDKRKKRAYFKNGSFVEVHTDLKPGKYSIYYQRPDGTYLRWDNSANRKFPRIPHVHEGKIKVGDKSRYADTPFDVNKVVERLRREHGR